MTTFLTDTSVNDIIQDFLLVTFILSYCLISVVYFILLGQGATIIVCLGRNTHG